MNHTRDSKGGAPAVWLLLTYKVPAEPTKLRVGIWRRIRSLGAVYLQSGLAVLPSSPDYHRQLRMVQAEIELAGGEALLFETQSMDAKQQELVISRFKQDRDQDYEEFLDKCKDYKAEIAKEVKADFYTFAELKENDEDLKKLKGWLERIKALDFFGAPAQMAAERELVLCEELLESYANEVFEREQAGNSSSAKPRTKPSVKSVPKRPRKSS